MAEGQGVQRHGVSQIGRGEPRTSLPFDVGQNTPDCRTSQALFRHFVAPIPFLDAVLVDRLLRTGSAGLSGALEMLAGNVNS